MLQSFYTLFPVEIPLFALAILLSLGVIFGKLAKIINLPSVTGYIIAGLIIGKAGLHLINIEVVDSHIAPITDFALGLIAVTVGNHLNIKKLRNAYRRIFSIVLIETLIVPLVVGVTLYFMGVSWLPLFLISAISIATSPASVVSIIKETKSKGVFVKTLVAVVALNNVLSILLFETIRNVASNGFSEIDVSNMGTYFAKIIFILCSNAVLGSIVGFILTIFSKKKYTKAKQLTATLAAILFVCGLANAFSLSALLSALFMGVFLANFTPFHNEIEVFNDFEEVIFALFFTIAGTHINFTYIKAAGFICIAYVLARMIGKYLAIYFASNLTKTTEKVKKWLGIALVPQAGVAIGLVIVLGKTEALAEYSRLVTTIILGAVVINETLGPIFTRFALAKSGEINKDRARLIDFLHEENVFFNVPGDSMEEVLKKMSDFFCSSNQIRGISSKDVYNKYLTRETELPTCIGHGVMIPHIKIPKGEKISGVIGVSKKGFNYETHDGKPIKFIIMFATPEGYHELHLEILAAISRYFMDTFLEEKIYRADSSAKIIEILHSEEHDDLNYFIED